MEEKKRSQDEKLDELVKKLCEESVEYKNMKVASNERRRVMRSLMNIRMLKPVSGAFLKLQDEFLQEEARERGIVKWEEIPTLQEAYGIAV